MIPLYNDGKEGEPGVANLYCQFTALAAGAVPTSLTRSNGFRQPTAAGASQIAVVKAGTGLYDFFLWNAVPRLLCSSVNNRQASFSASGAVYGNVTVDNVATPGVGNAKVRVTLYTAAGAPVDLAVNDVLQVVLTVGTTP